MGFSGGRRCEYGSLSLGWELPNRELHLLLPNNPMLNLRVYRIWTMIIQLQESYPGISTLWHSPPRIGTKSSRRRGTPSVRLI